MKNIKGTIKFYNKNLVKKTIGTGAFILVAEISSSKNFTIICSIGAGLMIANIISKLKERRNEVRTNAPKKSKRSILVEKLKELKAELLETNPEIIDEKEEAVVIATPKVVKENNLVKKAPVEKIIPSMPRNSDPLGEYIARQKQLKK
jgi:hypothetical protein